MLRLQRPIRGGRIVLLVNRAENCSIDQVTRLDCIKGDDGKKRKHNFATARWYSRWSTLMKLSSALESLSLASN